MLILKNASVITCENDDCTPILASVVIDGGKIEKILPAGESAAVEAIENSESGTVEIHDCTGKYLMPGLINSHAHLLSEPYTWERKAAIDAGEVSMVIDALNRLEAMANAGITYFRDCGGYKNIEIALADKLAQTDRKVSEYLAAGQALCITGGHSWWMSRQCDGEEEFKKAVRENSRDGADFIKLMVTGGYARPKMRVNHSIMPPTPQMTLPEIKAAVDEAHRLGKRVAAHCIGFDGVKLAVQGGVDSVEHGQFHSPGDKAIDDVLNLMVKNGTYIVPTLSAYYKEYDKNEVRSQYKTVDESFKRYLDAGVKIAMGDDAGCPFVGHSKTANEPLHQCDAGMSTAQSIISATKTAAELLNINSSYGTLTKGKFADILVLEKNPLNDITALQSICAVYKKGKL